MSVDRRGWRRLPISPLAHSIRMDAVRQANIYPTCRLDKSSRAVYEPEDVWAKRAALVKPDSRSSIGSSRTRGLLKQKVHAITTTGVTKTNMESVDRVKETVAVLMKNKEHAADIGTAERRVLQPQVARRMARMNAAKKSEFEKQVQQEVERFVYAAKRRFARRQAKLDEAGVFHPEANAHRVHTQFWADLNSRVNITKIENEVWAKMCAGTAPGARSATPEGSLGAHYAGLRRAPAAAGVGSRATAVVDSDSARPSSKGSSRHDVTSFSKEAAVADDDASKHASIPEVDETVASAPSSKAFAGILGYEELGHVPTLEEFRSEWAKIRSQSDAAQPHSPEEGGGAGGSKVSAWKHQGRGEGQLQQQAQGSVVNELAKKDEVFRHFKKYYDKTDHNQGRVGDSLFSAGVASTGLLQPDFEVIEAVGRHTAKMQELRSHSRVGEGILSAHGDGRPGASRRGDRGRQRSRQSSKGTAGGQEGDGLANFFRESMPKSEGLVFNPNHGTANSLLQRCKSGKDRPDTASLGACGENSILSSTFSGSLTSMSGPSRGGGRVRSPHGNRSKGGADNGRAKVSLEGSSTSAELQARLETAWRALFVPARLKLDFLQKYSTLERVLELPRTADLLETASKAVPLREKVVDHVRRIEEDGEPISAATVFSTEEEGVLYDLDCWENFGGVPENVLGGDHVSGEDDNGDEDGEDRGGRKSQGDPSGEEEQEGDEGLDCDEVKSRAQRRIGLEREMRQKVAEAVLAWLRSIESHLAAKCAEVCDAAWYDLGETITYKGRPVAYSIPATVMEAATKRRENREDMNKREGRPR